jgi:hypothetical protein
MDTLVHPPRHDTVDAIEPIVPSRLRVITRKVSPWDRVAKKLADDLAEEILAVKNAKQAAHAAGSPDPYPARRVLESGHGPIMLILGRDGLVGVSAVLNPGMDIKTASKEVILPAVEKEFPGRKFLFVINGGPSWPGSGGQAMAEQAATMNLLGGPGPKPVPYKYQKG